MSSVTRVRFADAQANRSSPDRTDYPSRDPIHAQALPSHSTLSNPHEGHRIVLRKEKVCETTSSPFPPQIKICLSLPPHTVPSGITHHLPERLPPQATHTLCFRYPRQDVAALPTPFCDRPATLPTDLAVYPAIAEPTDARGRVRLKKDRRARRGLGKSKLRPEYLLDRRAVACSPQPPRELPPRWGALGPGRSRGTSPLIGTETTWA